MDNFDYKAYLKNNPLLKEIKINDPRGKLRIVEPISGTSFIYNEDNPGLKLDQENQNYLRVYKNHATQYFADIMSDGSPIENYKEQIKDFEDYLKKLGIKYKIQEKTHASGYNYTNIQIPLDRIEFLPSDFDQDEEEEFDEN